MSQAIYLHFYTSVKAQNVIDTVFKQVSQRWENMQGFFETSDSPSDDDIYFEGIPDRKQYENKRRAEYFVYRDKEVYELYEKFGCGVNEIVDEYSFQISFHRRDKVQLVTTVESWNKAFINQDFPDYLFQPYPHKAVIYSSKLSEIILVLFEDPEENETASWIYKIVYDACCNE